MPTAPASQAAEPAGEGRSFRRWRRTRPFWAGLLLILSGVELFLSGNMSLGAMEVHVGPTGFLSYVVPAMLVLCGAGTWMTPHLRMFYGILGSLVAVYSLIGVNFGGFVVGLLLGIIGGALAIAWAPVTPPAPPAAPRGPESAAAFTVPERVDDRFAQPYADPRPRYDHGQPYGSVPGYGDPAGVPREVQNPDQWWGTPQADGGQYGESGGARHGQEEPPPPGTGSGGGYNPRMLAITLVPVTLAAALVMVVHPPTAAYAAPSPCPTASSSATPKPSKSPRTPTPSMSAANNGASAKAQPSATPGGAGNPFLDVWNGLVNGMGKIFGAGKDENSPATSAADPSPSPSPSASAGAGGLLPGLPVLPSLPALPSAKPSQPKASGSAIPCLGAGPLKTAKVPPGLPMPASTQAVLTGQSVTMINSTYDGVVEFRTKTGTVRALQFTMQTAVKVQFQLKVPEPNGKSTVITSDTLTIDSVGKDKDGKAKRTVKFYATKFQGDLTLVPGLPGIPVTFTPDSPPPLTLPVLTFTNPVVDLVLVRSDVLRAPNMHVNEV